MISRTELYLYPFVRLAAFSPSIYSTDILGIAYVSHDLLSKDLNQPSDDFWKR